MQTQPKQPDCKTRWHFMRRQRKCPPHISLGSLLLSRRMLPSVGHTAIHKSHGHPTSPLHVPDFRLPAFYRSHAYQYSPMLHLLLHVVKWQLIPCFKSSKPIQIGPCMLMSLSVHLHGLHPDAQCGQTWHPSTLCS